jgi:hypothetical protein
MSTLYYQLNQRKSWKSAYENQQLLTSTEESTLVKWVSWWSKAGFPISLPLMLELAKEIQLNQYPLFPPLIIPLLLSWR